MQCVYTTSDVITDVTSIQLATLGERQQAMTNSRSVCSVLYLGLNVVLSAYSACTREINQKIGRLLSESARSIGRIMMRASMHGKQKQVYKCLVDRMFML